MKEPVEEQTVWVTSGDAGDEEVKTWTTDDGEVIVIKGDCKLETIGEDGENVMVQVHGCGDGDIHKVIQMGGEPVQRTFLGVGLSSLTPELQVHFGSSEGTGIMVSSVVEGSPAARAGLTSGFSTPASQDVPMPADAPLFPFDNSYARLPERFFAHVMPTPVAEPELIRINHSLARELGLDPERLASREAIEVFAGNRVPKGAEPLAMAYAGFQFGNWVPQLGDGRAILLGEVVGRDGVRRDIQLKGPGRTPFSRNGDGRAGLGPVLREYIVSEAMHALGIPTTRSLAAVTTGERILRETPLPGAVLTRVARSHIRVGTFQFFAGRRDVEGIRLLSEHVIARHYRDATEAENPVLAMFDAVVARQAELIARWQLVGFIHGVMNTDNTSIAGETIDYGPCAFMDDYHPDTVYSSIDRMGRYAYSNQPPIALWNLRGLANALLPAIAQHLADSENPEDAIAPATEVLQTFPDRFLGHYQQGMRAKLGLQLCMEGDEELVQELLTRMADHHADFTLTFRRLSELDDAPSEADRSVGVLFDEPLAFEDWAVRWRKRLATEPRPFAERRAAMRAVNPAFIARNHRVEEVIQAATGQGDLAPLHTLLDVLATPYEDQPDHAEYARPPRPEEVVHQTFCGT